MMHGIFKISQHATNWKFDQTSDYHFSRIFEILIYFHKNI
jgi:hypothetical protein